MLSQSQLADIVRVGIELGAEKDPSRLLEKLLRTAMTVSSCDAGTIYLYRDGKLHFRVMKTLSQGVSRGERGETIDLPPVELREENVCAYAAIHRELINIPEVYASERFDFSGPKRYDALTGYRTGSMLVIPMEDLEGSLVGVLQLMNKLNGEGHYIPFSDDDTVTLQALGSMTAVSLANMLYIEDLKVQMHSFVRAFATAVDERTPYNGSHTRKVTFYARMLAMEIQRRHEAGETEDEFSGARIDQLTMAAALHDIGKMIVPLDVMNKSTRLDSRIRAVRDRFRLLETLYDRDRWKGRIDDATCEAKIAELKDALALIEAKNGAGFLPDADLEALRQIAGLAYTDEDGTVLPYLTEEETDCLTVRKGTLTAAERRIMEGHVDMTEKILRQVRFRSGYGEVLRFASEHHEYLNGTGYPRGLTAQDLPLEARILTVVDVYDALTSADRPYKAPIPRPRAFAILRDMAKDGQIEARLVDYLESALQDLSQETIEQRSLEDF